MKLKLPERPKWVDPALQGLTYWMGFRQSLYAGHPVPEAAMVNEVCNLIFANLDRERCDLFCEVAYGMLVPLGSKLKHVGGRARADLVVVSKQDGQTPSRNENFSGSVEIVIEVKRGAAQNASVQQDLHRLAEFKRNNRRARAFLFLVSEGQRPSRFVDEDGRVIRGMTAIPKEGAYYRVRRACKASRGFKAIDTAHYACMIEVFVYPRFKIKA